MQTATKKLARQIASELRDFDRRSAVEQMAAYLAIGDALAAMVEHQGMYGATAIQDTVECVPQLRDEKRAYAIMELSRQDTAFRKFILEQTAVPMGNGHHLTLVHWLWLMKLRPRADWTERREWLLGELAWLREESPSAAVVEHIEGVLGEECDRQRERVEERVREAIEVLESL